MKVFWRSLILLLIVSSSNAQPAQWRGPDRDGHFPGTGLLKSWPEGGPELIVKAENIGKGWSSPILADNMIYVSGMIDTLDYLTALDLDGNVKWQVAYGRAWNQSFPDTRSTPVVEDDRIYVQSGTGRVVCINRETGEETWAVEVDKDYQCEYHVWGNSETPLVIDDKVICTPGGKETSVVALNKLTGELIWKSESVGGPRSYISATTYELNGQRFILTATASHLISLEPESGKVVWTYQYWQPEKWKYQDNGLILPNTPIIKNNEIFITTGYNYPAVMLTMDSTGTSVTEKFVDHTLDNHIGGVVLHDGYIYGSNWFDNRRGRWVCMDWETGEIKYVADWDTKGPIVIADGLLYAYNERGNVGLIKPDPNGFEVISEFRITEGAGPHWAHPFIADGKLLMRHGEVLFAFDIKEK
ncbi:alcohol dehydrogenase [Mariniphaga sediminis]|uniref:Alcohol dehydrogenase n=1 Tax=Mariniphaga sediminis TaxID=1628158 RepID=A0A399CZG2_9BACT|nr:PQQ-binding-like beta-propeller repeat protein [Mariniphaga sediminis]RIH65044.1 alcohol dehydrogenase [Mariniphaga sediminis]